VGGLHRLQAIGPLDREYQREEVAMTTSRWIYIHTVLDLYVHTPDTPGRICSHDRRLAEQWFIRQIPIPIIEMALLLGVVRRIFRRADAFQLAPIRSMAYFRPVVEELMAQPPPLTYIQYLRYKLGSTPNINTG
jgi:hypothetical protein